MGGRGRGNVCPAAFFITFQLYVHKEEVTRILGAGRGEEGGVGVMSVKFSQKSERGEKPGGEGSVVLLPAAFRDPRIVGERKRGR